MKTKLHTRGRFQVVVNRADGSIKHKIDVPNLVVNEGRAKMLDIMFNGDAQIATWYCGLVDNAGFSQIVRSDTMPSHGGWVEFVGYSELNRQEWNPNAAVGVTVENDVVSLCTFTITGAGTLHGGFITSDNVKGGINGILWAAANFDTGNINVIATDVVNIIYSVTAEC